MELWILDPNARLDYAWDWSAWLATGETITSMQVLPVSGLTVEAATEMSGVVVAWVSGGTVGVTYSLTCEIETSEGRTDRRTIRIHVKER